MYRQDTAERKIQMYAFVLKLMDQDPPHVILPIARGPLRATPPLEFKLVMSIDQLAAHCGNRLRPASTRYVIRATASASIRAASVKDSSRRATRSTATVNHVVLANWDIVLSDAKNSESHELEGELKDGHAVLSNHSNTKYVSHDLNYGMEGELKDGHAVLSNHSNTKYGPKLTKWTNPELAQRIQKDSDYPLFRQSNNRTPPRRHHQERFAILKHRSGTSSTAREASDLVTSGGIKSTPALPATSAVATRIREKSKVVDIKSSFEKSVFPADRNVTFTAKGSASHTSTDINSQNILSAHRTSGYFGCGKPNPCEIQSSGHQVKP
ncbi:hypothetical protein GGX14DRAFT_397447 [Mycena pura]|uniref:Uncharacterized protein n=1 Tax=Mycena pura TaxID=153505 RepID=A0AAD6Y7J7_9AGAR|nr:hypothetical protein GGX14DRAFT_397447 [Mycena pura]